jgi:hypothetical protein
MRARVKRLLWLAALVVLLAGCTGPILRLPTPTSVVSGSGRPTKVPPDVTPQPALLEKRALILEWPETIREKDSGLVLLTLAMDEQGRLTATVQVPEGSTDQNPVEIPNIYDTHNIVAVARLDLAGMEAYREEIRETLRPGQETTFRWSVRANEAGYYRGVVWLHLQLVPKSGGPIEEQLLLSRPIEIEAVTVLGMAGSTARILGIAGLIASTVLGYPFIQQWIESHWKKPKKTATKTEPEEVHSPEE